MPDSTPDKKTVSDVETAFKDALRTAGATAIMRQNMGERVEAHDVARNIVTGTATNFIMQKAKENLCDKGYMTSVTCERRGGGNVDFIFDVNDKRVIIGVSVTF